MKKIFLVIFALSSIVLISCNSNSSGSNNNTDSVDSKKVSVDLNKEKFDSSNIKADTKFAVTAADGGMLEVQCGTLALTKGNLPEVKNLGQMMVNDHAKANDELKALAANKNISIPAVLGTDNQSKLDKLASKAGKDFDKAYTELMVSDHKEDIDAFKKEVGNGK
ncbi:MAG: DUF4142 domain-containing protein, partial [Ferruginibacter sp.]|nr:DUF4142 domain-containing protein [Ferruginibacter sp.]